MESSSNANSLLEPNFALNIYNKFGKIKEIVPKMKSVIEEFRMKIESDQSILSSHLKNNSKSNELREEAEELFFRNESESTLFRVLELYNESLCYAEPARNGNGHLAIVYVSRARVYFDLKEFEICLDNIRLAEDTGYVENDLNKLKADCLELTQKLSHNQNRIRNNVKIQLNVKHHQRIPFAASSLELKTDAIQGRYIASSEDIDPGSIIITESPFVKVLSCDYVYQRCTNCLERNSLNLIPCPNCTKAMFCTELCMQEASKTFHRFECPIIDCLLDIGGQITMRTFLKAIESFNSIPELIEFLRMTDTTNQITAFSFDHSEKLSPQQNYHQIHCLSTNQDIRTSLDLFTHTLVAALFYFHLNCYCPPFMDLIANNDGEDNLMELMFHIELITSINSFNFDDLSSLQEGNIIGTGLYPLSSLINHSCSPNASAKFYKNNLVLYTTQAIQRGESISIGYTGSHAFLSKDKRQSFLFGKYHFSCKCVACTNDFPLLYNMPLANIPEIHSNDINIQLDKAIVENIYRKCRAYLREYYHRHYPCREIYSAQICLSKVLSYFLMRDDDNCSVGKLSEVNPEDIVL